MPIYFLPHKKIDFTKWDTCIQQAYNALPYAFSWYLDAVTFDAWDALVLDDYKAVMPLPYNRKLFGFKQIYQPFFAQQLGVFSIKQLTEKELQDFVQQIPKSYWRINTQLNTQNQFYAPQGFELQEKSNYILALDKSYNDIRGGYSKGLKYNLKQASKHELRYEKIDIARFIRFYEAHPTVEGRAYNQKLIQLLHRLLYKIESHKMGHSRAAFSKEGKLIAAFFCLSYKNRNIYLQARSSAEGKQKKAMPFLLDFLIQQLAEVETEAIFDFEGSSIPNLAKFFRSFGAKEELFYSLKKEGAQRPLSL